MNFIVFGEYKQKTLTDLYSVRVFCLIEELLLISDKF